MRRSHLVIVFCVTIVALQYISLPHIVVHKVVIEPIIAHTSVLESSSTATKDVSSSSSTMTSSSSGENVSRTGRNDAEEREKCEIYMSTNCPNNCSNHGVCTNNRCVCENFWGRKDCSMDYNAISASSATDTWRRDWEKQAEDWGFSYSANITMSGCGSTIEATRSIRDFLDYVLIKYNVSSFRDTPCGDMVWMPLVLERHPDMKYFGGDLAGNLWYNSDR